MQADKERNSQPFHIYGFCNINKAYNYYINRKTHLVETAVDDLVDVLLDNLDEEDRASTFKTGDFPCSMPTRKGNRCAVCLNCVFFSLICHFSQANIDAIISCKSPLAFVLAPVDVARAGELSCTLFTGVSFLVETS